MYRLNEGFATDLMYSLLEEIYPDWHMKEFFSRNVMIPYAFTTDAIDDVRSMSSELVTTDDINDSFDDIAYDKGNFEIKYKHFQKVKKFQNY